MTYPSGNVPPRQNKPAPEEKKIEPVAVSGPVIRRKTPLGKKLRETFIGGDSKSVGEYLLTQIVVPTIKDLIADLVGQGIEQTLYGTSRSSVRRAAASRVTGVVQTAYNRAYTNANTRPDPRPMMSRQARASHNFDEIILTNRAEAEEVIERLIELIDRFQQASVADLYEIMGQDSHYTDDKWGWNSVEGMGVSYVGSSKYLLDLPKPTILREA